MGTSHHAFLSRRSSKICLIVFDLLIADTLMTIVSNVADVAVAWLHSQAAIYAATLSADCLSEALSPTA
jgi:hypothetical protein